MSNRTARFEYIEHTADVGVKLYAPTQKGIFRVAAQSLFAIICDLRKVNLNIKKEVNLQALDQESLLVNWLSELNYIFLTEKVIPKKFDIVKLTRNAISAEIRGELLDLSKHEIYTEVKAVTYHGLYIKKVDSGYEAQVIFDL